MKKISLFIVSVCMLGIAYSQDSTVMSNPISLKNKYTKPQALVVSMIMQDHRTDHLISGNFYSNVLFKGHGADLRNLAPGINVTYIAGVNDYLDVLGAAQMSVARLYNKTTGDFQKSDIFNSGYIGARGKYPSDKSPVSVYLEAGIGLAYSGKLNGFAPIGGGFQFNIMKQTYIYLGTNYNFMFSKIAGNYVQYNLGFGGPIAGLIKWPWVHKK